MMRAAAALLVLLLALALGGCSSQAPSVDR